MTGTVVVHKTQVGQSSTAANNFTIRTLDDGSLRISRGNAGAETSDVLVIDTNGNFSTAPVLGVGQTWQDVKAIRTAGTTYTNTTGKPIFVAVTILYSGGSSSAGVLVVNGVTVSGAAATALGGATFNTPLTAIVPPGGTYLISSLSGATINVWTELR